VPDLYRRPAPIKQPRHTVHASWWRVLMRACVFAVCGTLACASIAATPITAPDAGAASAALSAKYTALSAQLAHNQFGRPLYLVSTETPNHLQGDIYAVLDYPAADVIKALQDPTHWCDILLLHLNTKYCRATTDSNGTELGVNIGGKYYESLQQAFRVNFAYRVAAVTPDYLAVELAAPQGPMGTSDYRIRLETVALPGGKTFLHLTYAYAYNFAGRLAMQAYLATIGSAKVGFTTTGTQNNGQPAYIGGVRGVVERNTMRYYLAIDAYLSAAPAPPAEQFTQRLQTWFAATEHYPLQLHEVDLADYLDMKQREYQREQ